MKKNILVLLLVVLVLSLIFINNINFNSSEPIKKVAFVSLSEVDNNTFKGFKEKMVSLGWEEDKNIKYINYGAANIVSNLEPIISKVISKKPDLILVSSTPATQKVKEMTNNTIPVVFCPVNDPVSSNIVKNPKNPEGSITGIRLPVSDAKRFEWLNIIVPDKKNILIPYTPNDDSSKATLKVIEDVAKTMKVNIIEKPFDENIDVKQFLDDCSEEFEIIFIPRDSRIEAKIDQFVNFANKNKLVLSAPSYQQVQKGALYTYGFIHKEIGKDAAKMVDRILKGVSPQDLPVKFGGAYLVINSKTAKQIGVKIPKSVLRNTHMIIK